METSSSTAMENLDDTSPLPELSFDDLLDTGKNDSIASSLVETLEMGGDNVDNESADDDKMNDSLNTPAHKKYSVPIKILENRRLSAVTTTTTLTAAMGTAPKIITKTAATCLNFPNKTLPAVKAATITTATPTKISSTTATAAAAQVPATTSAAPPILLNSKNSLAKSITTSPITLNMSSTNVLPMLASGGARLVGTPKSGQPMANATLTTIDGKAAVRTADGRILYLQKTTGPKGTQMTATAADASPALGGGSLVSKVGINQPRMVGSIKTQTVATGGKSAASQAVTGVVQQKITPTPVQKTLINTAIAATKSTSVAATAKTVVTAASTKPQSATATPAVTPKVSPKPMAIHVVRTADGKLMKINPAGAGTQLTAAGSTKIGAATTATTAVTAAGTKAASSGSGITITQNVLLGKKVLSTAGGQFILKTPPATKNVNLQAKVTPAGSSTMSAAAPTPVMSAAKPLSIASSKLTTSQATKPQTPKILNAAPTAVDAGSSVSASKTSVTPGKVLMQTTGGKQIYVSNQQFIKLSPKGDANIATAMAAGHFKTVQIQGKQGVQYVRVMSSNAANLTTATSSAATAATKSSVAGTTVATAKTMTTTTKITPTTTTATTTKVLNSLTNATAAAKTTAAAAAATATSSSTTAATSGAANSSNFKILNALPQKFTIVRGSQSQGQAGTGVSAITGTTTTIATATTTPTKLSSAHKFILKRSPNIDGGKSMPILAVAQKKPGSVLNMKNYYKAGKIYPADGESIARKHKISDMNMEIKRMTGASSERSGGGGGDRSSKDEMAAPEAKRARYVFLQSKSNSSSSIASRLSTSKTQNATATTSSSVGNIIQRVTVQGASTSNSSNQGASNRNSSGFVNQQSKNLQLQQQQQQQQKTFSLLRSTTNGNAGRSSYVVVDAAQLRQKTNSSNNNNNSNSIVRREAQKDTKSSILPAALSSTVVANAAGSKDNKKLPVSMSTTSAWLLQQRMQKSTIGSRSSSSISSEKQLQKDVIKLNENLSKQGAVLGKPPIKLIENLKAPTAPTPSVIFDASTLGGSRRKHCNCSKSQCLKLYCDCFANGEFCQDCTCKDCFNNLQYEDERQRAIKSCLDRNPSAFKPKITARQHSDMRLHNKGCNCKRSGCLKNYCECFEAKIPCSSICKCIGCRNMEDRPDVDMDKMEAQGLKVAKDSSGVVITGEVADASNNFITEDVIDATIMCMISQVSECEKLGLPPSDVERNVMEELGRCLVEILDFSIRNADSILLDESAKIA